MSGSIAPGTTLGGRWRLVGLLGAGGFGEVFEAEDTSEVNLGRAAVKVLHPYISPRERASFVNEVQKVAGLRHQNLVGYLDSGLYRTGPSNSPIEGEIRPYLVAELCTGSLGDLIKEPNQVVGRDLLLSVLADVLAGLTHLHQHGLIHRDIKPANVLHNGGSWKLADFGLMRDLTASGVYRRADALIGTPMYMAPELFQEPVATRASDIFAVGVMTHICATGRVPFARNGEMPTPNVAAGRLALAPDLDPQLALIVASSIDPDPARRPEATELANMVAGGGWAPPVGRQSPPPDAQSTRVVAAPSQPVFGHSAELAVAAGQQAPGQQHSPSPTGRRPVGRGVVLAGVIAVGIAMVVAALAGVRILGLPSTGPITDGEVATPEGEQADLAAIDRIEVEPVPGTFTAHTGAVTSVTQLVSGHVASASTDSVLIWSPADPDTIVATYAGHADFVTTVIGLANGNVASGSLDGTVQIWNPTRPDAALATYRGHPVGVAAVVELASGNLASAGFDRTVRVWDPDDPETTIATYLGHRGDTTLRSGGISDILELGDGTIATVTWDDVQVWDPADPDTTISTRARPAPDQATGVASAIGLSAGTVASTWDTTVEIWHPDEPNTTIATYLGHGMQVQEVVQLPDGMVASVDTSGTINLWDPANPEVTIASYDRHTDLVESMVVLFNGMIASGDARGTIRIWDPSEATPVQSPAGTIIRYRNHSFRVESVTQLTSGLMVSVGGNGDIHLWDAANPGVTLSTFTGHREWAWWATELADGTIASAGGTVQIWDPKEPTGTAIATYAGHIEGATKLTQAPSGNIVSAGQDGEVHIWDPADPGTTIATYTGHSDVVLSVIVLSDGTIASGSGDGTVHIWDPADPDTTIAIYTGHAIAPWSLAELANGTIASAGGGTTVHVWDPANPDAAASIYGGHTDSVWSVIALADGTIASASQDTTVRIWDPADTDTTIAVYDGHTEGVNGIAELADGTIASASTDSTVHIWNPAEL